MTNIGTSQACSGASTEQANGFLKALDDGYRRVIHVALQHRPTVIGAAAALVVLAVVLYPRVGTELLPQTDEGQVNVNAQLPIGTRMEVTESVMSAPRGPCEGVRARSDGPRDQRRRWRRRLWRLWQHEPRGHADQARSP
jgi:hypothetical protein